MASVEDAAAALAAGQLVILPTETVYGLAADAANPVAVARLFEAKGRPRFNPLIAHVASLEGAMAIAELDERALALAEEFWPGPLTLVGPAKTPGPGGVCDLARAGLDTVAVRAPAHPVALAVLQGVWRPGGAIQPTGPAGQARPRSPMPSPKPATSPPGAGRRLPHWSPSPTVVSLLEGPPRLLRPGALTRAQSNEVSGPLAEAEADARRSPGRLTRHYAPAAPLRLDATDARPGEAFIGFGNVGPREFNLSPVGDLAEAAARLFSILRAADATKPVAIAVAAIPLEGLGEAINDRLMRAAGLVG